MKIFALAYSLFLDEVILLVFLNAFFSFQNKHLSIRRVSFFSTTRLELNTNLQKFCHIRLRKRVIQYFSCIACHTIFCNYFDGIYRSTAKLHLHELIEVIVIIGIVAEMASIAWAWTNDRTNDFTNSHFSLKENSLRCMKEKMATTANWI